MPTTGRKVNVVEGEVIGYLVVNDSGRFEVNTFADLEPHLEGDSPSTFLTRYRLADGTTETVEGVPIQKKWCHIGKKVYRHLCGCGQVVWLDEKISQRIRCEEC